MKHLLMILLGAVTAAHAAPPAKPTTNNNPLLAEWTGPYGGVPPFDKVKVADFKPAIEAAMEMNRAEIEKIANNEAAPTFANTILAMEKAGKTLSNIMKIYGVWGANLKNAEFQAVEQEMAPKLAAFNDEIIQSPKLYARIKAVYESPDKAKLNAVDQRLVWLYHNDFTIQGAGLSKEQKAKVADINKQLATLETQFGQNVLADEEGYSLTLTKESELAGLPQSVIDSAADAAEKAGKKGQWLFANTRSSMEPFLTYSTNRDLREKAFKMWTSRGENNNSHNNNKTISKILKLRQERSKLLGYETFAHWQLANKTMAKDPKAAMDLMMQAWKPAVDKVKQEVAEMQAIVDSEKGGFKIQPWDYRFYAEKVRKAKYDLDFNDVKPYMQLEKIQDAMFWAAEKLYGIKFSKIKDVPVFHPSVTTYKVTDKNGKLVGLWYFDPYARQGKQSGAWMTDYRLQNKMDGKNISSIVSNNSNFIQGKAGKPTLISWDDANTMFHEFGHALHGLLSNVKYPSMAGTNVSRDFVEFPSQVNENFMMTKQVLKFFTNEKGQPIPKDLIAKIEKAKTFNQGFQTVEFLASGIVDMKLHLEKGSVDAASFEKKALKEIGMPSEIVMRHRTPAFQHIFSGAEYAAGYYSYLWAQVLSYDAYEAFTETGNSFNPKIAKGMKDHILSIGNTVDPSETYRLFRGRDAKIDPYLRARGFPVPNEKSSTH